MDQDHQLADRFAAASLNGPGSRDYYAPRTTPENHRPPPRDHGHNGNTPRRLPPGPQSRRPFAESDPRHLPRNPPPAQQAYPDDEYAHYGPGPSGPGHGHGPDYSMPPARPTVATPSHGLNGHYPPQRPTAAPQASSRPTPHGYYKQPPQETSPHGLPRDDHQAGNGYPPHEAPLSADDVLDSYFDNPPLSDPDPNAFTFQDPHGGPVDADFAPAPARRRGSFTQTQRPLHRAPPPPGPGSTAAQASHHAKARPAVFEMAGDIPVAPAVPPTQPYPQRPGRYGPPHPGPAHGYDPTLPPHGGPLPQAGPPPGHRHGRLSDGTYPSKPVPDVPHSASLDTLPSHPAPVRPGLMPSSTGTLSERPPPVRNYGAVPQAGGGVLPPPQISPPPSRHQLGTGRPAHHGPEAAADASNETVTSQELERLRMMIKSNPGDQDSALRLAKKLTMAADTLAPKVPDPKQRSKVRERYLADAHKILKKLASNQNQEAMFTLADGLGRSLFSHEPDYKEAFTLYQSAAKLGHSAAAYRTAVCCEIGHEEGGGTRKDPLKAMQWYRRAATLGDPPAMYKVGMILLKGLLGQTKNPREAVGWLKRAAEQADTENPHALHELGLLYETAQPNDVIIRDEPYALGLFQQAAELGYKFSQFRLGCAFEHGQLGCPVDARQSIYWYSQAATQQEHQSELALSGWYLTGSEDVMSQSDTEAYLWARKAAMAGLAKAEYAMGYFTEVGIGVPANLEDAKRWYWRAAGR